MKEFISKRLRVWENINRTMQEFKVLLLGYRNYTALLTQTGTDAPVATVLENTLGFDIVWYWGDPNTSTPGTGYYLFQNNSTGILFDKNKTWINTPADHFWNNNETPGMYWGQEVPVPFIGIIAPDGDGTLNQYPIEIRVYN
jgi:hypothetical protein